MMARQRFIPVICRVMVLIGTLLICHHYGDNEKKKTQLRLAARTLFIIAMHTI